MQLLSLIEEHRLNVLMGNRRNLYFRFLKGLVTQTKRNDFYSDYFSDITTLECKVAWLILQARGTVLLCLNSFLSNPIRVKCIPFRCNSDPEEVANRHCIELNRGVDKV